MKYYNLEETLSRNANINFVIGHRSAGKTYAFKDWAIKTWISSGAQWGYIRRNSEETNVVKASLWDDLAYKYGYLTKTKGMVCYIRKMSPENIEGKELKTWNQENPWEIFGYFFSLSDQQIYKSMSLPKIDKLCYDEIILENLRKYYIPNEVDQLMGLIDTIARHSRRVRTVCLSNAGFLENPFFQYYNIKASDFNGSDFVRREKGKVLFHYFRIPEENTEELKNSVVGSIANKTYKEYAFENKFRDSYSDLIEKKPKNAIPRISVACKDGFFTIFEAKDANVWYIESGRKASKTITVDSSLIREDFECVPTLKAVFKVRLDRRAVRFASLESRILFLSCV